MSAEALDEVEVPQVLDEDLHAELNLAAGFEKHLALFEQRCKGLLDHFERAAKLANTVAARHAQDGREIVVEAFLDDYYDLLDPIGVAE